MTTLQKIILIGALCFDLGFFIAIQITKPTPLEFKGREVIATPTPQPPCGECKG